ncbi:regulator of MON1-CCZ1 complex isoform X5 [Strigops habroptila]|uniref:regulator of MON1-CCZ1 complex isoform X5 n=1 Tax=Strigops habroptila TaxID=2489341 RepID=UPI0011CEF4C4|nr:regulator of MON1-CCZ1 complex isoform X5 [Strigops habroptila]
MSREPPPPGEEEAAVGGEGADGRARAGDGGCYLALCARPVHFEKANPVNCVFFDEANKQVFAVRSGGATGVVVKGLEDRNPISFRMEDKGEVKCIKFSLGNKILAVQRTLKSVDFLNFIPDSPQLEYTQECKTKNANILGFCWTSSTEIVFITDQGIEFYQVLPEKRSLKLLKNQSINVNWYMYCPESSVILLSTTVLGNVLQPFYFKSGTMSKLSKFEIELPAAPKSSKLSLSERDIAMATIYGQLYVLYLRHHSRTSNSTGAEVVLYHLPREGSCKKTHVLKLNRTGKFALNVVDNLVVVHHQDTETSVIFDIKLKGEFDGSTTIHQFVLPPRSIQPYQIPVAGPASVTSQSPVPCKLYSSSWIVFQPDIIISASEGYLWSLQVKLEPVVNLLLDKGKLMDFLLQRKECKMVILSVCSQMLSEPERGSLSVIATVFDKLNHEYKKYLEAEQSYTMVVEAGLSRSNPLLKRPVRTQAVIDQSDMYTHVLSVFTEKKRLSTANDEIVEVLLSKHQVLAALRFIRGIGGHDSISARKFLDAAKQAEDDMLFYTIFRFFEQRNQRLRGNPSFTPGEHCEEHVTFFKQVFGEQALMKPTTL